MLKIIASLFICIFMIAPGCGAQGRGTAERIVYAQKDTNTLWFDYYRPQDRSNGMTVLFVHGGAFTGGDPANQYPMGVELAKRGYHVFVIKYRLYLKGKDFGCRTATPEKLRAIHWAVEDALDATRYLLDHARQLGVDTSKIFLSGSSAGAETILNLLFNPFRKNGDSRYEWFDNFRYAGAMSFAGALLDLTTIEKKSWVPLLLMHGTNDQLVPFKTAAHRFCTAGDSGWVMFFGSHTIYKKAKECQLPLRLYTFVNSGHEVSNFMFRRFEEMDSFMHQAVRGKLSGAREIIIKKEKR